MGNILETEQQKESLKKFVPDDLKWKRYVNVYKEGSEEFPEDPKFPKQLLNESMGWDNGSASKSFGTYVYYPGENRAKMWIGNYRCLNPEDFICPNSIPNILHDLTDACSYPGGYFGREVLSCIDTCNQDPTGGYNDWDFCSGYQHDGPVLTVHGPRATSSEMLEDIKMANSNMREYAKIASGHQYNHHNWNSALKAAKSFRP